jgi:UDP-N-acetyl-D-mannosaminouronate:lipid I N-acetyl-D-mannosaminouronosyltransferase
VTKPEAVQVGGIEVCAFASVDDCARHVVQLARGGPWGVLTAMNAEKVILCRRSESVRRELESAQVRYPDGVGVVAAMRVRGVRTARIPGADLWLEVMRQSPKGTTIALLGASQEVLAATAARISREFPHVDVALTRDGYRGCDDVDTLGRELQERRAAIVFIAMGSPRQELMAKQLLALHASAIYMGLGGSFDIFAGHKRRAPLWMQRASLEWLYRLLREPTRFLRQTNLVLFAWLLMTRRL